MNKKIQLDEAIKDEIERETGKRPKKTNKGGMLIRAIVREMIRDALQKYIQTGDKQYIYMVKALINMYRIMHTRNGDIVVRADTAHADRMMDLIYTALLEDYTIEELARKLAYPDK